MSLGRTPEQERLIRHLYYLDIARNNLDPKVVEMLARHEYDVNAELDDLRNCLQAQLDALR